MVRYNPDGTPDPPFGTAGVATHVAIDHASYFADLLPDGSIRVRGVGHGDKRTPIPVEGGFDAADNGTFEIHLAPPGADVAAAGSGQVAGRFTVQAARRNRKFQV